MRPPRAPHPRCNTMNSYCSAIDWPLSPSWRTQKKALCTTRVLKLIEDQRGRLLSHIPGGLPLASGKTESSNLPPLPKSVMTRIDVQRSHAAHGSFASSSVHVERCRCRMSGSEQKHAWCMADYAAVRDLFEEVLRQTAVADRVVHTARSDGKHVAGRARRSSSTG